jgi:mRNA capping enzyme
MLYSSVSQLHSQRSICVHYRCYILLCVIVTTAALCLFTSQSPYMLIYSGHKAWTSVPVRLIAADLGGNIDNNNNLDVWTSAKKWHKGPLSASAATATAATATAAIAEHDVYDIVSMQFALHYMGQTEAKLRKFFRFISDRMRLGAQFIATTADARVLVDLLMRHSEKSPNGQVSP